MSELEPNYLAVSTYDPLAVDPLLGGDTFPGSGFDNSPLPVGDGLNLYPSDKGDKLPGAVETILTAADPGDWLTPNFEDNQEADNPDGEKDTLTGEDKTLVEGGDTLLGSGDSSSNTTKDGEATEDNTTGEENDATATADTGSDTRTSDNLVVDTPEEDKQTEVADTTNIPEEDKQTEVADTTNIPEEDKDTVPTISPAEEAEIYQRMQPFTGGVFTVGDSGQVKFDFLYDGGSYKGELAIFSLQGMGEYEPGSPEFIAEAARRANSNSPEGYIVISDPTEGARFNGLLNPYDTPRNQGEYKGVKTFAMTPGGEFGVILVPNGTIQEVLENPNVTGFKRPLFSMTLANPHEAFHVGQIADVTGDGHTYVLEDKRLDSGSDGDYDDFIFQVRGATAQVIHLSQVINPKKDWRQSDEGKALIDYADLSVKVVSGYIEPVKPELSEIVTNAVESAENLDNYQAEDLEAAQEWVIWINPAQNADNLAGLFGAENLGATGHIDDTYIWKFPEELTAAEVQNSLKDLIGSEFAYPLVPINLTKPQYLPKDPLAGDQWHLENTGQTGGTPGVDANILDAQNLATGNGIVIAIVDDGVESGHIDLQDNFRDDLSIDFNGTPQKEYPLDATPDVELESNWLWWFWQWYNRYYQPKRPTPSRVSGSVDPDQAQETSDPFQHGTAVAGIAAADNNGEGVSGVAPDAEIASVRLTADSVTEKQIADALAHEPLAIAIYNNSWKPDAPLLAAPLTLAALENGVKAGRDGKGNIYVFAGGNDGWLGENVNSNPFANSRYTIAVGAIDHNGTQAWYSEPGASLLVSAPSSSSSIDPITGEKVSVGITTTDLQGEKGYNTGAEKTDSNTNQQYRATSNSGDQKTDSSTNQQDITNTNYTNQFGGTSAAAPIVSGVVALMLEANPDLTWRDVQHILVETATKNNPTDTDWVTNSGGYQVNQKYGFGLVNGAKAVAAAQTWTNVAPEIAVKSNWQQVNTAIPDYDTVGLLGQQVADILSKNPADVTEAEKTLLPALPPTNSQSISATIDIAQDINIEWVEVVFDAQHSARGDLKLTLVSPDGTESLLTDRHADPNGNYDKWTFTSNRHWGESSQGEWTLKVADEWGNEVGTWNGWKLNFYGTENPTVNIRATDNNATEDGNSAQYIVTRTGGNINKPLTVEYQIGGTATNGSDYTINGVTSQQTITFAPGQTTATIGINPIHDYEVEPTQNVQLSLVDAGGYHLGNDTTAAVTITNSTTTERYGSFVYVNPANGHQYILSEADTWLGAQNQAEALGGNLVTINDAAENQWVVDTFGSQPFWIGLTDSEMYGQETGDYQWVNGEPATYTNWLPGQPSNSVWSTGTEHFGEINRQRDGRWNDLTYNWLSQPGIIEIDPATIGQLNIIVTDAIAGDDDPATIGQLNIIVTDAIAGDDDPATIAQPIVNIMVTDAIAGEDGNAGQIVMQRLGNLDQDLTINYTVAGDATNGGDYRGLSGSLTIPAGETLATMPIIALPDDVIEANETLVVNLAAGDYQIGSKPSGHVVIADQNPINRIANEVIGRDVALLAYWTQRWQNGETLAQLRPAIIQAGLAAQGGNQAETKIAEIYQDILGRAATSSEIASARSQLETGATLSELRQQLEVADIIDTSSYVYTNPVTGNRYFLTTPDTWLGAQEQAQALGGNLVTIDDAAENQWLFDTFGNGRMWLGLNDSPIYGNTEGNHQWVSGEATYTNWLPTEPNNASSVTPEGEDFSMINYAVSIYGTAGWNDTRHNNNLLSGIVEISYAPSYNWTWTYFGEDFNPNGNHGVLTNTPNVDNARNAFLANLINIETEDFESFVDRETPSSLTFGSETATVSGVTSIRDFSTGNYNGDGTYPISGNNSLFHYHPSGTFTLDFDTPQSAVGFTLTDAGDLAGQLILTLHHEDGTTENLLVPHQHEIYRNSGSAVFFGITDTDKPLTGITFTNTRFDGFGLDDLIIGQVNPNRTSTPTPPNQTLNLTYTEDTTLDLSDIVVSDPDGETTVTLTLSNPAAGVLSNSVGTGQYNATTGVWTASGAVADVNAALADLEFVPTANFNQDVSIAVAITDDFTPALTGTINLKGIAVNDAPTLTTTSVSLTGATENAGFTLTHADLLAATGATDVDGDPLTFRIQTVGSDVPTKNGQPVTAGVTTLSAGEAILWTPTTVGNAQPAFTATLTDGKVTVATPVTVSVDVNPVIVTIDATDPDATEGSDTGEFTFTRTGDTSEPMTVNFTIEPSIGWARPQAKNGTDYATIPTSITIPAGQSSVTLTITSLEDTETEWPETVRLKLAEGNGYEINSTKNLDTVVIWDNETPKLQLMGEWYTGQPTNFHQASYASESGNNERFLLRRIGSVAEDLTVYYSLPGTATNGEDYEELPGSITIPAGQHDVYFTLIPIDDSEVEGDETVEVTLTPDPTYTFMNSQGRIWDRIPLTLVDNDDKPTVQITVRDNQASEYGDPGQFTISRTGDTSNPLTVDYWISTAWWYKAKNGIDYQQIPESITIPAGQSSITIDINPIDDNELEENEIVDIYLKSNPNYAMRDTYYAQLKILDNETQRVQSRQQFGTSANDIANSVAVDSAGNTYTVGNTTGNFGGTNRGGSDAFITKRNSSGSQLWQIQLGTASNDEAKQIALDSANNLYVLGWSGNSSNSWIAKYDNNGTQQWQKPLGSAGYDITNGALTIGNDGSLYVTGRTTGNINGTNQGATDAWVAKYDSDGTQTWVKQLGTTDEDEALGIAVDNNGNIYITGSTKGSLAGTREGDGDAWVAQLDSNGNLQWQTQLGTTAVDIARSIAVDNNGRVYLGGQTFGWLGQTYAGDADDWVGDNAAWWAGIHGDRSGFGGTYYGNGDAWVAQLNSTTGTVNWKRLLGTTNADSATKVVADSLGNVYLAGRTQGKLATSQFGADDIFLAKYNLNGALQWKQQLGTAAIDIVNDMVLTSSGIYLTGDTTGNLQNTNKGGKDAWVIKLA